ncbi:MAG TPA: hypothetical protein P5256_06380 [Beijerinckiaceae bacterium]|nr:hypothetical protein [Rhodoblastus sp.]MCC2106137.1 hypothetical protein [Hyphomicrobiales bacterium]HPG02923.1 hypothetical protein [Rhodoblastus sp.]HRY02730.1 hypothetical protein [Beijerinckiaceae bacterium]
MLTADEIDQWNEPDPAALRAAVRFATQECSRSPSLISAAALLKAARFAEAEGVIGDALFLNALATLQDVLDQLADQPNA